MDTHPSFRIPRENATTRFQSLGINMTGITLAKGLMLAQTEAHPALKLTCYVITIIFTVELLLRFTVCPNKYLFFKSFFNIVDIFSVVPMAMLGAIRVYDAYYFAKHGTFIAYTMNAIFSVLRSVRIFKIVRHNRGLQLILLAIKASLSEIALLIILMGIGMYNYGIFLHFSVYSERVMFVLFTTAWLIIYTQNLRTWFRCTFSENVL